MSSYEHGLEFDAYQEGIKAEHDHIIKLLDENQKCRLDGGHDTQGYCFCIARQLIKGENK